MWLDRLLDKIFSVNTLAVIILVVAVFAFALMVATGLGWSDYLIGLASYHPASACK